MILISSGDRACSSEKHFLPRTGLLVPQEYSFPEAIYLYLKDITIFFI